jgi:peptidoglycan-associated lipoprotein
MWYKFQGHATPFPAGVVKKDNECKTEIFIISAINITNYKRRRVVKMRKAIIFMGLIVFVFAYAGCAEKQITKSEGTASTQKEQATQEQAASQITTDLKDINFDFDKYNIRSEDGKILSDHAAFLLKNKNVQIVIEGNCDERGTVKYNLALGDRRAKEAKKYLVKSGVDSKRIKTISYGKERPLDPGHDEDAWAKNRNDHFVLSK